MSTPLIICAAILPVLTTLTAAGVIYYYQSASTAALGYVFDYNYFLYFPVFHVVFSFTRKRTPRLQHGSASALS